MYRPGDTIADRFTVLRTLGVGGMGVVYEVEGSAIGNRLALKIVDPALLRNPMVVERFRREARLQAAIDHPGVCKVFDLVETGESTGLLMEFVSAPTLRELLEQRKPTVHQARTITCELLEALAACHAAGIVHRDLKPENIFVLEDVHGGTRCKLTDFGVAKDMASRDERNLTQTKAFVGTYTYASPEQIASSQAVDERSDLYAVGVLMWEMLSGIAPYADLDSAYSVQAAVVNEPLPLLPNDVPPDLRRVVVELTRKRPEERPGSAAEVIRTLRSPVVVTDGATVPEGLVLVPPSASPKPPAAAVRPAAPRSTALAKPELPPAPPLPQSTLPVAPSASRPPANTNATQWDPSPEQDRAQAIRHRRSRAGVTAELREQRLSKLLAPMLGSRLLARLLDEAILQLFVLSCIGILLYPFAAGARAVMAGRSLGSLAAGQALYSRRTGLPATRDQIILRNVIDLVLLQAGLVLIVWPIGWSVGLPLLGLAWLVAALAVDLLVMVFTRRNRRVADLISGTVMVAVR